MSGLKSATRSADWFSVRPIPWQQSRTKFAAPFPPWRTSGLKLDPLLQYYLRERGTSILINYYRPLKPFSARSKSRLTRFVRFCLIAPIITMHY